MTEPLYDLLSPHLNESSNPVSSAQEAVIKEYLTHLSTLPLSVLTTTEPQSLLQTAQSLLRSLQALSKRSHKSIIAASDQRSNLREILPQLATQSTLLQRDIPKLENVAVSFSQKYSRTGENPILDRRRKAMLLSRNVERISDVLELPTLLSTAISSSSSAASSGSAMGTTAATTSQSNYTAALDLHAHIKRLNALYPNLKIIQSISAQAEEEMENMTANLISSLQAPTIKLAGAMRTIGWLRRVAPELTGSWKPSTLTHTVDMPGLRQTSMEPGDDIALSAVFLVCRLSNLQTQLSALEPLRELADQEMEARLRALQSKPHDETKVQSKKTASSGSAGSWTGGQQTERYLKRYIEIFREQSFAIVSMHRSIFPTALPPPPTPDTPEDEQSSSGSKSAAKEDSSPDEDPFGPVPSPLATFTLHVTSLLSDTLSQYLPNIRDKAARDSLLTQVLFCASSLGRLGGDFSMLLAVLSEQGNDGQGDASASSEEDGNEEDTEEEWAAVMRRHRIQASRLQMLASGLGTGRSSNIKEKPEAMAM